MELITAEPQTVKSYWLPYQELRIMPLGDIQYGSNVDMERLKKYIAWAKEQNVWFLGMGDYLDVASPSNRKHFGEARPKMYDSFRKAVDDQIKRQIDELCEILKPSRGRWLGLLRGHHYWDFEDGTESDQRIADYLKCPFLGDCGVLLLRMKADRSSTHTAVTAKIWAHHGPLSTSAQLQTAPLTRLEHVAKQFMANVYIVGHYTKKGVTVIPWIDYEIGPKGKLRTIGSNRYLVASGGYTKAYEVGSTNAMGRPAESYAGKAMMGPTALGSPLIMLRPVYSGGYSRVDVNVSV